MSLLSAGLVRSVVLEGGGNESSLVYACLMLAQQGYELWRGGAPVKAAAACAGASSADRVFALVRD
jgi:hypothetical protein